MPVTSNSLLSTNNFLTVISFLVKVPVLSEQITVVHPSVSTEGNFLTKAFLLIILCTPKAREIVTTAGKPSGIAATAKATDVIKISIKSPPFKIPAKNTIIQIPMVAIPIHFPRLLSFFCNGVIFAGCSWINEAILPICVSIPVCVTIALPRPNVTSVPEKTMFFISAICIFSSKVVNILVTGVDSPVKDASCVCNLTISINLASAGTFEPSSNTITSPGTKSFESISCSSPSLITIAFNEANFFNASIDFSALYSCINPKTAFKIKIKIITVLSKTSPSAIEIIVAAIKI